MSKEDKNLKVDEHEVLKLHNNDWQINMNAKLQELERMRKINLSHSQETISPHMEPPTSLLIKRGEGSLISIYEKLMFQLNEVVYLLLIRY
jgi:hypothetical protein